MYKMIMKLETKNGIELKAFLLWLYVVILATTWVGLGWKEALYVHVISVVLFSVFYFGSRFIYVLISPLMIILVLLTEFRIFMFVRKFPRSDDSEVAVVIGYSDWKTLEGWIKPNVFVKELKTVVNLLKKEHKSFSFYLRSSPVDIEKIMADKNIREVYFMGHGTSHVFQLSNNAIIYYCDFNKDKHGKNFVHQLHCGTKDGKSLLDYVVSEENKSKCFFVRKSITSPAIVKELKKRIKSIS